MQTLGKSIINDHSIGEGLDMKDRWSLLCRGPRYEGTWKSMTIPSKRVLI